MSLDRLAARMRNAIGRALLALVDDAKGLQVVQVQTRADVVRDRAERFQDYGLTSVPLPGAEAVALAVGGSTDHTIVIAVDDRRYRMKGLAAGEVALYDDQGQSVHLTRAGIVVKGAGKPIKFTDTSLVEIDADLQVNKGIKAKLDIVDQSSASGKSMAAMRATYNGHTHTETNSETGVPNQPI